MPWRAVIVDEAHRSYENSYRQTDMHSYTHTYRHIYMYIHTCTITCMHSSLLPLLRLASLLEVQVNLNLTFYSISPYILFYFIRNIFKRSLYFILYSPLLYSTIPYLTSLLPHITS